MILVDYRLRLTISDGASKTSVTFNEPNPVKMERLEYHTGASEVNLIGLGNAHVKEIEFNGGAGSYKLDFSGELKNDMNVRISAGMSDLTLTIPSDAHAIITINGGLSNINANGTWTIMAVLMKLAQLDQPSMLPWIWLSGI